jgi:hypothetical protein
MTGIENAQHDLSDAQFSLETAIDLLSSINDDCCSEESELYDVIKHLMTIKSELATSFDQLRSVQTKIEH